MNYLLLLISILFILFVFTGCAKYSEDTELEIDIKELVKYYSSNHLNDETASITADYLYVQNKNGEKSYKLPEDEFFVSIAPYIEQTHP